jgi:hypothetical protein
LEITVDIISIIKHFGLCFGMKSNGSFKKEKNPETGTKNSGRNIFSTLVSR